MPELSKNSAKHPYPKIDFDEWVSLAKSDPEKFEAKRSEIIEAAISCHNPARQQRLRRLQWKIDQVRGLSPTPLAACIKISNMMWDSLSGPGGTFLSRPPIRQELGSTKTTRAKQSRYQYISAGSRTGSRLNP